jgi:hypothetical protein
VVQKILSSNAGIVSVDDFAKARLALGSISIKTATIERILSDEDLQFVSRSGPNELEHFFLKQRRMLVMHWFRTTQKQVAYLMDIHLRLAAYASPSSGSELKLGVQYGAFMAASGCLVAMFWLLGPYNARRTLAYLIPVIDHLFGTFRERLERINGAQLHPHSESLVH